MCNCQPLAEDGCDPMLTLERKLMDVMNDICDLLGSVRVDEWLSFPSLLAANIQRLLLQRFLLSYVDSCRNCADVCRSVGWHSGNVICLLSTVCTGMGDHL